MDMTLHFSDICKDSTFVCCDLHAAETGRNGKIRAKKRQKHHWLIELFLKELLKFYNA
jgi:hypothetical protein